MEKEWTFDQPTKEGFYWLEESLGNILVVKIRKNFFNEKLGIIFPESADYMELIHAKGMRWFGPITHPPIKLLKEEVNEKSDS